MKFKRVEILLFQQLDREKNILFILLFYIFIFVYHFIHIYATESQYEIKLKI